jgi:hypothetical protein
MQVGKESVPESHGDGGTRAMALEHGEITEQIIGAAFEVYSILGYSFRENDALVVTKDYEAKAILANDARRAL